MLKELWRRICQVLVFVYIFLIAYGTIRTGIDKIIEMNKKNNRKEKILSEMLSTKEGGQKLARTMREVSNDAD